MAERRIRLAPSFNWTWSTFCWWEKNFSVWTSPRVISKYRASRNGKTIALALRREKYRERNKVERARRTVIFILFDWNNSERWLADSCFSRLRLTYALRFEKFPPDKFLVSLFHSPSIVSSIPRRPHRSRCKIQMHFYCAAAVLRSLSLPLVDIATRSQMCILIILGELS